MPLAAPRAKTAADNRVRLSIDKLNIKTCYLSNSLASINRSKLSHPTTPSSKNGTHKTPSSPRSLIHSPSKVRAASSHGANCDQRGSIVPGHYRVTTININRRLNLINALSMSGSWSSGKYCPTCTGINIPL
jgi:hypothetical protein